MKKDQITFKDYEGLFLSKKLLAAITWNYLFTCMKKMKIVF